MDRRVRERRRLIGRERGRRRAGLIFLIVLAFVAAVSFLVLRSTTVFAVERVTAVPTRHVGEKEIAAAVADARGVSLLKVSTRSIEKTLELMPYVRNAHVYREFPDALEVRIDEYEPVARVRAGDDTTWLVADDGSLLEKVSPQGWATLPLIVSAGKMDARAGEAVPRSVLAALPLALLVQEQGVASQMSAVDHISVAMGGAVVVHLQGGTELRLGEPEDLKQKMKLATEIVQKYLRDGKALEYVDASAVDRVAAKPK
jgi:cell division septal protein FtsQ